MASIKKLSFLLILLSNIILFAKLKFFTPLLSGKTPLMDFEAYYMLIKDIKVGINPYSVSHMQTLGPPLVFLYFFPYSFFKIEYARSIFSFVNILSGFLICFLLSRRFFPKKKGLTFLLIILLLFSSFPARFSIENGQNSLVAGVFIALILSKKESIFNGLCLGIISSIKTFFILSFLSFLKNKRRTLWWGFISFTSLILLSLFFLKIDWYIYFFRNKFPNLLVNHPPHEGLDYYNQSLNATLLRFGLSNISLPIFLISIIISLVLIMKTGNFELSLILSLLLSPISWQHYFVSLFPIFVKTYLEIYKNTKYLLIFIFSFFLFWIELPWLHDAQNNFTNKILSSHFFFSGLILAFLVVIVNSRKPEIKSRGQM